MHRVLIETWVSYYPDRDEPTNPYRCPISNSLKQDPDVIRVFTSYEFIAFNYQSSRESLKWKTPLYARVFIRMAHAYELGLSSEPPAPFMLQLRESDLIERYWMGPPIQDKIAPGPPIIRRPVNRSVRILPS